jgi:hypothetical protein
MVMIFEAKGCVAWWLKRPHVHLRIDERKDTMSSRCFHEPQQKTTRYIWIFRTSMECTFQRIKRQGNRKFLQADMAESPMVAHAEILDSKQC